MPNCELCCPLFFVLLFFCFILYLWLVFCVAYATMKYIKCFVCVCCTIIEETKWDADAIYTFSDVVLLVLMMVAVDFSEHNTDLGFSMKTGQQINNTDRYHYLEHSCTFFRTPLLIIKSTLEIINWKKKKNQQKSISKRPEELFPGFNRSLSLSFS